MTKPRILVVEDEAIVAQNIRESLHDFGYQVAGVAASGMQALRLAKELQPDLVLMDIRLIGNLSGVETAAQLRGICDAPVVYLSAFTADLVDKPETAGAASEFVQKPYAENALHAAIEFALQRSRSKAK
jgi:two-component system, response regulator PdtaR